jgi:TolB-like protein
MNFLIPVTAKTMFSDLAISNQLQRIFLYQDFSKSLILKKFLSYIVHETLTGNSNCLKEYTIALKVLEKPPTFNPQKNCIVRIHAGRLRIALNHYYGDSGSDDEIIIDVPKGKYVPVFMDRQQWLNEKKFTLHTLEPKALRAVREPVTIAILPFVCSHNDEPERWFSDSLCLYMCSSLSQLDRVSVIAFHAVKNLAAKYIDIRELGSMMGFNYVVTGGVQYMQDQMRMNIQLIDCNTYRQLWAKFYEYRITTSNLFDIQDQVCRQAIDQVRQLSGEEP